ncbi:Eukaryotic translation initiation factor 3 subunit L [Fusarium oxysporum f. sp. albedinis]|nr:Eukaryotic translation initiation factor 3 subunit L [Fusarium oxysporum f. sp. albedinis]KAK2479938.1 hypothetical protein H9L39_09312 [Fusarium oxysporum f. sp. albedinis]
MSRRGPPNTSSSQHKVTVFGSAWPCLPSVANLLNQLSGAIPQITSNKDENATPSPDDEELGSLILFVSVDL